MRSLGKQRIDSRSKRSGFSATSLMAAGWSTVLLPWKTMAGWWRRRTSRQRPGERPHQLSPEAFDVLSSDLINELAAIRGYCELATMQHPDDAALAQRMEAAMAACTDATASVQELRAWARNHPSRPG